MSMLILDEFYFNLPVEIYQKGSENVVGVLAENLIPPIILGRLCTFWKGK